MSDRRAWTPFLGLGLTITLALAAAGEAPPVAARPPGATKAGVVVPFEMLPSNHMVVRARVNGEGPFRLVFDLGAPITLLSNKAGEASGVVKKGAPRSLLFAMRGEGRVKSLQVGGLTAKDLPVIVLDHPALRALGGLLGRPLDGIIGFTFFARYKTTIDYQAREMTFEPVDFAMRDLLKDLPERLAGPKVAKRRVLAPAVLFGLTVGEPVGGLASAGVPVVAVWPDSAAAAAGVKAGDVLTSLDGRWTASVTDAYAAASGVEAGRAAPAVVLRDGKELTLNVTPREGF